MFSETAKKSDTEHSGVADRDVKKYLRSVKKLLHCPRTQRNEFLRQLETNIYFFISESEVEDMEEVIKEFGSPEEIAQNFLDECNSKAVSRSIRFKQMTSRLITAIVMVTAIVLVSICLIELIDNMNFRDGAFVETIGYGSPPPEPENTFIVGID